MADYQPMASTHHSLYARFDPPKWLCALGLGLFGLASFSSGGLNPDFAGPQFNQIQIIRALSQPLIMVTISLIATTLIVPTNPQVAERMASLTDRFGSETAALGKLSEIAHQQASIMAYNDAFHFVGIALGISMLAVLLTKALPAGLKVGEAH